MKRKTQKRIFDGNAIMLRRRQRVLVAAGASAASAAQLATVLKNLESLGYTCSGELIQRLATLDAASLSRFLSDTVGQLSQLVGAHVKYTPMYPNFPSQVMEMDEAELYLNAIMHYLGDWIGVRIMPVYVKEQRPALADELTLKVIGLADEDALIDLGRALLSAKTSLSQADRGDVAWFIRAYKDDLGRLLPDAFPHKENLCFVAACLLEHNAGVAADVLGAHIKTATDVLRLAVAMSAGDVSLATVTRFRSFRRAERRALLALVERMGSPLEDMLRYRGRWVRLGERLHPTEQRTRFPRTAAAFDTLRSGGSIQTFGGTVERLLAEGDAASAVTLLRTRPGELARRLDHLLRLDPKTGVVVATFRSVADAVSTPVLLQVMAHFKNRALPRKNQEVRSFFPKGNVAKLISIPNTLSRVSGRACRAIVTICREVLEERFSALPTLGRVYLDEGLRDHLVPFSQRSASKALRTLVRGSSMPLPAGNTVRFFLWWKEGLVNGVPTGRVDIDLSAAIYSGDWEYMEHISYTNLKSSKFRAVHSGDITSAPNGAAEFIDLDIRVARKRGARYIAMNVYSFTSHGFCNLPECFAGWMMRQKPGSGEIFDPRTVVDKVDLAADTRVCIPVILDLYTRRFYWADMALTRNPVWTTNVESNKRSVAQIGKAITTLVKPNLYELFELHTRARGQRVASPELADTVFSIHQGVTPFAVEEIMSRYL